MCLFQQLVILIYLVQLFHEVYHTFAVIGVSAGMVCEIVEFVAGNKDGPV